MLRALLFLLGVALIVAGVALVIVWLSFIVAGVLVCGLAALWELSAARGESKKTRRAT